MNTNELRSLAMRILADASDDRIDDATFRRRALRLANKLRRDSQAARYVFLQVGRSDGGAACVSIKAEDFAELAHAMGGRKAVSAAAKRVAVGYKADSGVSRSHYVRSRLQRRLLARA